MPVYLDNAATTRVCPEAARAALEAMTEGYGNPSSGYALGQAAAAALKEHRAAVAGRLGCAPEELIFTSCGTEGDNWAVRAAAEYGRRKGRHIITTAIEHAAVLEPVKVLAAQGYEVTYLKPDRSGHVSRRRPPGRPAARHGAGVHDAGEQRAGHPSPRGGGRPGHPGRRLPRPAPLRRGAGLSEGALHPGGAGGGSAHPQRP